jgi:hypothetical protein
VDVIQWSGGVPESGGGADWEQITYTYDPTGRRIAKDVDGEVTKYVYDGESTFQHAFRHALGQKRRFWWQEGGFLLTLDQLVEVQILVPQFINAVFETKLRVTVHIRPYACYICPDWMTCL